MLAAPAMVVLSAEAMEGSLPVLDAAALMAFTLSISSFGLDSFAKSRGTVPFVFLAMLPPLLGIALAVLEARRLGRSASSNVPAQSIYAA